MTAQKFICFQYIIFPEQNVGTTLKHWILTLPGTSYPGNRRDLRCLSSQRENLYNRIDCEPNNSPASLLDGGSSTQQSTSSRCQELPPWFNWHNNAEASHQVKVTDGATRSGMSLHIAWSVCRITRSLPDSPNISWHTSHPIIPRNILCSVVVQ